MTVDPDLSDRARTGHEFWHVTARDLLFKEKEYPHRYRDAESK